MSRQNRHKQPVRTRRVRRAMPISIVDRDGVNLYNARTFREAMMGVREYVRFLLEELPQDYELRIHGLIDAMSPLDWLIEDAVITDGQTEPRKGGAA